VDAAGRTVLPDPGRLATADPAFPRTAAVTGVAAVTANATDTGAALTRPSDAHAADSGLTGIASGAADTLVTASATAASARDSATTAAALENAANSGFAGIASGATDTLVTARATDTGAAVTRPSDVAARTSYATATTDTGAAAVTARATDTCTAVTRPSDVAAASACTAVACTAVMRAAAAIHRAAAAIHRAAAAQIAPTAASTTLVVRVIAIALAQGAVGLAGLGAEGGASAHTLLTIPRSVALDSMLGLLSATGKEGPACAENQQEPRVTSQCPHALLP
jgi:hypothetical protein